MEGYQEDQEREEDDGPIDMKVGSCGQIIDIDNDEEAQLDEHLYEVGGDACQGYYQAGEIDFSEDISVLNEDIGGYLECFIEVVPQHDT